MGGTEISGMQQTSLAAFQQIQDTGQLGYRQLQVLNGFREFGAHTNLELSSILRIPINQVTPRTNELVRKGLVVVADKRPCHISKKRAIVWEARKA